MIKLIHVSFERTLNNISYRIVSLSRAVVKLHEPQLTSTAGLLSVVVMTTKRFSVY